MKLLREYIRELLTEQSGGPRRMPLDIPIPEDLKAIHRQMKSAGMQLFLVGGAVRDALMNKVPKDYDVATDATPEAVIELLQQDPELRIDLTGKAFGVVRVKTPAGEEYEIATFRKDIGKGRRPDAVEFTTIEDDVKRRDLTINALFYDMETGEVVDYVGGIDDIKNGVIRAVGDPATRFDEDKLRILRTVRFAGRTGSDLDPATRDAILADNNLNEVSVERITEEFIKGIRSAQDVTHFLSLLRDLGLFQQVLPGLEVELTAGKTKDHVVQVAAMLANNDPNTVKAQLRKMKYSGADADAIKLLLDLQSLSRANAAKLKKEFRRIRLSPERIVGFAKLVDSISPKKAQGFISFAQSPPAANPRDLMAKGLKGPDVGKAMADAEGDAYDKLVKEVRKRVRRLLAEQSGKDIPIRLTAEDVDKFFKNVQRNQAGSAHIYATFDAPVSLYRIMDSREVLSIKKTGNIAGGTFNTPSERVGGAAYTINFDSLPTWGAAYSTRPAGTSGKETPGKGRLVGEELFIIEVNGQDKPFVATTTTSKTAIKPENPFDKDSKLWQAYYDWERIEPARWRFGHKPTEEQQAEEDAKKNKRSDIIKEALDYYNTMGLKLSSDLCTTGLGCNLRLKSDAIEKVWWIPSFDTPKEFMAAKDETVVSFEKAVEIAKSEKADLKMQRDSMSPEARRSAAEKRRQASWGTDRSSDRWLDEARQHIRELLNEELKFKQKGSSSYFRVDLPGIGYAEGGEHLRLPACQADVDALMQTPEYLAAEKKYVESRPPRTELVRDEETGKYVEKEVGPATFRPKFYDINNAWITNPENRGKGYGKEIYKAFIDQAVEYSKNYGGVFIGAHHCTIGSGTSAAAKRVWKSLAREYNSSGDVIFIGL